MPPPPLWWGTPADVEVARILKGDWEKEENVKEKGRRREGQREIEVKKVKRGKIKG